MRHVFLIFIWSVTNVLPAQNTMLQISHMNLDNGLAIHGYDPVTYFTTDMAVKGNSKFSVIHHGATYYFSSEVNKNLFLEKPDHYEPQYGGWCAFAMGDYAKKVNINPTTFKIADGRLYLFYNKNFNNTLKSWNKDENNLKTKADINWSTLLKQ